MIKLPPTFSEEEPGMVNVIIETPRGSRNKFTFDPETGLFKLGKILPAGTLFPLHFGFIPQTKAEDGDPLDVMVYLMDVPAYPGNLLTARLIGVIEGEQTEDDGKAVRNDRLLAVPSSADDAKEIESIKDISESFIEELTSFFSYYNKMSGKKYQLLKIKGPSVALKLVNKQMV
jgi:inorganic pyrophosphatase